MFKLWDQRKAKARETKPNMQIQLKYSKESTSYGGSWGEIECSYLFNCFIIYVAILVQDRL